MRKSLLIIIIMMISAILNGEWIPFENSAETELVSYEQSERGNITLEFNLNGYEIEQVTRLAQEYTKLSYPDEGSSAEIGLPDLPVFTRLIAVPSAGEIFLNVISEEYEIVSDIVVYPQEEFLPENDTEQDGFFINEDYYEKGGIYPENTAIMGEPAIMRDIRLVKVSFYPFRYDAAHKELYIYNHIEVELSTSNQGGINNKTGNSKFSRSLADIYRSTVLNFEEISNDRDEFQQPSILIIYPNMTQVAQSLEYLADWKRKKGFEVNLAHTGMTGTSSTSIKNYIQDAYDNWENPPEYLILVGDANGSITIPAWNENWSGGFGVGDHPYAQLEGDDVLADIIVGRISVSSNAELQTIISKSINYERDPYLTNESWFDKAIMFAFGGPGKVATCETVEEYMRGYNANYSFADIYYSGWVYTLDQELNAGAGYLCYRSQGTDAGWNPSNINGLDNGWMLPFGALITCFTGDFSGYGGPCLAESFVKAGTSSNPKGGIAAIGTSTGLTSGCFNNCMTQGIFYGIFVDEIFTPGGALLRGKLNLYVQYPNNPLNHVNTWSHCNNLIGDPSIDLWTGVPQNMIVYYDEDVYAGSNFLEIDVMNDTGSPLTEAWVTVRGEDFYQTGFSNESGIFFLDLEDAEINQDYEITITAHDMIPFEDEFTVMQADVNLAIDQIGYDDDGGDGIPNPGENIFLELTIGNFGSLDVTAVTAELTSFNDNIVVTNSSTVLGNIAAGESINNVELAVSIDPAMVTGENTQLELVMSSAAESWTVPIFVDIETALLNPTGYVVNDADGVIDPGETVEIYFSAENLGQIAAADIFGELISNDHRINILEGSGSFGYILPGNSGSNINDMFELTADEDIFPGTQIPIRIQFTNAEGYDNTVSFMLDIGTVTQNDPLGPDEYGYYCYDDDDTGYDDCPVFDWIEINDQANDLEIFTFGDSANLADVALPDDFNFSFYGVEYDMITVSSAGWICPGGTDAAVFMNWIIPGPGGPSPMIAAFWDDLHNGSGDVYAAYDAAQHFFIIEWFEMRNEHNNEMETFQIILYNSEYYVTATGDSKIKIQYLEFANTNIGIYPYHGADHGQFCTVGIENHHGDVGLQYTYNNQYHTAAKPLGDETAIMFSVSPILTTEPFLTIYDYEILAGDDEYIEAGEQVILDIRLKNLGGVTAQNVFLEVATDDSYVEILQGSAGAEDIIAGEVVNLDGQIIMQVSETIPDFHGIILNVMITSAESSWNRTLYLTAYQPNTFAVDQDSIYFELQPTETGSQQFTLSNIGITDVDFYIRTDETTLPERDLTGSIITMNTDSFTPGEETTWTFTVANASPDAEWISDVWLTFPVGVTAIDASDISGGSGGDLVWDGVTGAAQTLNWYGVSSNGWGFIHNGEIATWSVDVQLSTEFAGDMTLDWQIGGDGYGNDPHNIYGELILQYPLRWMNLDTSSGHLEAGDSEIITINFDSNDIEAGIFSGNVVITCDSWDTKTIRVVLQVSEVDVNDGSLPQSVQLLGNYPNPFNPTTEIMFSLPEASELSFNIYNTKGQFVKKLASQKFSAGSHSLLWDGTDENGNTVASGIYYYRLITGSFDETGKMLLMK